MTHHCTYCMFRVVDKFSRQIPTGQFPLLPLVYWFVRSCSWSCWVFDLRPFTYLEHCMLVPQNLISGFSRFPALSTVYTYKVLHWKFCLWVLFFYINRYYQLINYLGIPFVSVPSFIFFSQVFIHIIYILSTRCIWELKPSDHIFFILVCLLIFWLTMERS